ncbi:hypothetical protein HJFPF1_08420 [Paramyrothecium foliicola]|nr:hypothetical protein HJFPF1_08420 [Paramyrothecium foliicola]
MTNQSVIMTLDANQLLLLFAILLVSFAAVFVFKSAAYGQHFFWAGPYPPTNINQKRISSSGRTFRVRGVPGDWNADRLASFLTASFDSVPTIVSLAREVQGGVQSATVCFQTLPDVLRTPGCAKSIRLPRSPEGETSRSTYLQVDDGFHGITTLFIPPEKRPPSRVSGPRPEKYTR